VSNLCISYKKECISVTSRQKIIEIYEFAFSKTNLSKKTNIKGPSRKNIIISMSKTNNKVILKNTNKNIGLKSIRSNIKIEYTRKIWNDIILTNNQ